MAELTLINGVTKFQATEDENVFYYWLSPYGIRAELDEQGTKGVFKSLSVAQAFRPVNFDDIDNKLGTTNVVEYLDAVIALGYFQPIISNGGGGVPSGVSTEAKQDELIAKTDRYNRIYSIPNTKTLSVEDWQAQNGNINDDPYPIMAIRKIDGITNAAFIGLISAFNETNHDYSIILYRFNRNQIAVRTGETITWSELDNNLEGFEFPRTGTGEFTPLVDDQSILRISSRDKNTVLHNHMKHMESDQYEYMIAVKPHSDGADLYISLSPYSFNYE